MKEYRKILSKFKINEEITRVSPYGDGHINDTFLVTCPTKRYILQRINHHIFLNPEEVMSNISRVIDHLKAKIKERNGDLNRETLSIIQTVDNKDLLILDGNYYRVYNFIEGATTYQTIGNPELFYNSARAFGKFQKMLSDFPASTLHETIKNFHNTKDRFNNLIIAINEDRAQRKKNVLPEIEFALSYKDETGIVVDLLNENKLPLRVTHNDTKLNNVLIDDKTGKAICVVDLDTVMPASLLYDFGDSIRFGASSAAEDETDLSKVYMDLDLFYAYSKGFIEEMKDVLTDKEIELLPFGTKLMTYECGIRFLTDYLNGDTYFKIHREGQNLDRARTQFKLVSDMETKMEQMKKIVNELAGR